MNGKTKHVQFAMQAHHRNQKKHIHTLQLGASAYNLQGGGGGASGFMPQEAAFFMGQEAMPTPQQPTEQNKIVQAVEGAGSIVTGAVSAYQGYKFLKSKEGAIRNFVQRMRARGRTINDPEEGMAEEMQNFEGEVSRSFNAPSEAGDSEANFFTNSDGEFQDRLQQQLDNEDINSNRSFNTADENIGQPSEAAPENDMGDMENVLNSGGEVGESDPALFGGDLELQQGFSSFRSSQMPQLRGDLNNSLNQFNNERFRAGQEAQRYGRSVEDVEQEYGLRRPVPRFQSLRGRISNMTDNINDRVSQWSNRLTSRISNINRQLSPGDSAFDEFGTEMSAIDEVAPDISSSASADIGSTLGQSMNGATDAADITDVAGTTADIGTTAGTEAAGFGAAGAEAGTELGSVVGEGAAVAGEAAAGIGEAAEGLSAGAEAGKIIGEIGLMLL